MTGYTCIGLDFADAGDGGFHRASHELVHLFRLVTFDKERLPAAAPQKLLEFLILDAGQHGRVADLVSIQVQDRQDRSVANRGKEIVRLPGRRQRTRLCLAVADDARNDQAGIVERGTEGVTERVTQLTAFVDRPWSRRRDVAGDAAGK